MKRRGGALILIMFAALGMALLGCHPSERKAEQEYQRGLEYIQRGDMTQAAQFFRLALRDNPAHGGAKTELGVLFYQEKNYREAVKILLNAVKFDETSKPCVYLGNAYEQLNLLPEAETQYRQAILCDAKEIDARLKLADLLELQGKYGDAAALLQDVLKLKSDIERGEFLRSRIALLQKPDNKDVQLEKADVYLRNGETRLGLAAYHQAKPLAVEQPDSFADFGIFCVERQQYHTAIPYLEQAIQYRLENPLDAQAALGLAYEHIGETEKAIRAYQSVLQVDAGLHEFHLKLAKLLEKTGKLTEAADEFEMVFRFVREQTYTGWGDIPNINALWMDILRLRGEDAQKAVMQLKHVGKYPVIELAINGVSATLMIDQQAAYTLLSETLAVKLGIAVTNRTSEIRFDFNGATYSAPLVNLPSLSVGKLEVRNIPALLWNLSDYPEIHGVLGMSFLKHFQIEMKPDEQLVIFTKLSS